MNKSISIFVAVLISAAPIFAQNFFTRDGKIVFNSDTPLEKIEGKTKSATAVLETNTGKIGFSVLIKGFLFEKALLQEHFNENYMESSKFPKAVFQGQITNLSEINFAKEGTYNAKVKGDMTIHGVTKNIEVPGTIKVVGDKLEVAANFNVACADYNIAIPSVVKDKIAKTIKVMVNATLNPRK